MDKGEVTEREIIFDEKTAALLVKNTAELVVKKLMVDQNIRLDDSQMKVLAGKTAELISVDIDYPAIADNVISSIPQLKDNTDLFFTEAIRGDLFERIKKEIIKPVNGKDGKTGINGKDGLPGEKGKDYILTGKDKTDIAGKITKGKSKNQLTANIRADIAESILSDFMSDEKAVQAIVDAVIADEQIITRDGFVRKFKELRQMIDLSKKQRKGGINAGISGQDMIDEITKILGQDWKTQPVVPVVSVIKGSGDGFVVEYDTTTRVKIRAGIYEADGTLFNLDADTTLNLSLTSAVGVIFHYIYLDKSLSTVNTPVFYNETTAAVRNTAKNGHYHPTTTEDRLVGVVEKISNSATIRYFDTEVMSNKLIRQISSRHTLQINRVPNGIWQDPSTAASTQVPVNAIAAAIHVVNSNPGGNAVAAWRMNEGTVIETAIANSTTFMIGSEVVTSNFWGPLGPSRNIKMGGQADNQNTLSAFLLGYGYTR